MTDKLKLNNYKRPKLNLPNGEKKLLLHSCCAPCSGEIIEAIAASDIETTVYFYNPNIHPIDEYEIRKDENRKFCEKVGFKCIDGDYYKNMTYWDFNWRKNGGSSRMLEISKREHFYQQEYCGCVYSLRDTNRWRRKNNRDRIIRGIKYY